MTKNNKSSLNFEDIKRIENDFEKNEFLYQIFDEDKRLNNRVGQIEFLTTISAIEDVLKSDSTIFDIGAGTGAYSLYFAKKGYQVLAYEPASNNFKQLKKKLEEENLHDKLTLKQASSLDMQEVPDKKFDIVLLFGPLYHLNDQDDRLKTLMEARRICKDDGYIFIAFINHDMIPITETIYNANWFSGGTYDHETMRVEDNPFVFFNLSESRDLLTEVDLVIERVIASDGFSELLSAQIYDMDELSYKQYLKWHQNICEKAEMLGASNHLLFVCSQEKSIKIDYPDEESIVKEIAEFSKLNSSFSDFLEVENLTDDDLTLKLSQTLPADKEKKWLPTYRFMIILKNKIIGEIDLRIGYNENVYYGGHLGYYIAEEYRGKNYAGRACKILISLARAHDMSVLYISNEYRNYASKRVCEKLGADHLRTILLPKENDMRKIGHYFENIFKWDLE